MKKFYLALGVLVGMSSVVSAQSLTKLTPGKPAVKLTKEQITDAYNSFKFKGVKPTNNLKAGAPADTLLTEDFEDGFPVTFENSLNNSGQGWEVDTINAAYGWNPSTTNAGPFMVCNDAKYDDGSNNNAATDTLFTELLTFSEGSNVAVLMDAFFLGGGNATAEVIYSVDGGAWASLNLLTGDTGWQSLQLITPEVVNSDVTFGFVFADNGSSDAGFAIDNVVVKEAIADFSSVADVASFYATSNLNQVQPLEFVANLNNLEVKDVSVDVAVGDLSKDGNVLANLSLSTTALGFEEGLVATIDADASITPSELGIYDGIFETGSTPADENTDDNFNEFAYVLTDSLLSADNGIEDGEASVLFGNGLNIGIGVPVDLLAANVFPFFAADTIKGLYVETAGNTTPGISFIAEIYLVLDGAPDYNSGALFEFAEATRTATPGSVEGHYMKLVGGALEVSATDSFAVVLSATNMAGAPIYLNTSTRATLNGGSSSDIDLSAFGIGIIPLENPTYPMVRLVTGTPVAGVDLALGEFSSNLDGYSAVPVAQANYKIDGVINNVESGDASNAKATIEVAQAGATFYTETVDLGTIPAGDDAPVSFASFLVPDTGIVDITISVSYDEEGADLTPDDNSGLFQVYVSDSLYSRVGNVAGLATISVGETTIGGAAGDGIVASLFSLSAADTISSIVVGVNNEKVGQVVQAVVYDFNGGAPDVANPILSSDFTIEADDANPGGIGVITIPVVNGNLPAGEYLVGIKGATATDTVDIALGDDIVTPGTSFLFHAGNAYDFATAFGAGNAFTAFMEVYFGREVTTSVIENTLPNVSVFPNPSNGVLNVVNAQGTNYVLTDITGKTVASGSINNNMERVSVENLTTGTYILRIASENGVQVTKLSVQ